MTQSFANQGTWSTLRTNVIPIVVSPEATSGYTTWGGAAASAAGALTVWGTAVYADLTEKWAQRGTQKGPKSKALQNVIEEKTLIGDSESFWLQSGGELSPEYHFVWNPETKTWDQFTPSGQELISLQHQAGPPKYGPYGELLWPYEQLTYALDQTRTTNYKKKRPKKVDKWRATPRYVKRFMKITFWSPTGNGPC